MISHARLRFEYQDDFEWIRIYDQYPEEHRVLKFETSIQGVLNLKDHGIPVLEYIRVMFQGGQMLVPEPQRTLIGGLGSCALLHAVEDWCTSAGHGSSGQVTVVESNPRVVDLGRRFFRLGPSSDIVVGDFRGYLDASEPGAFDLVFVDCYSATAIPPHLSTVEFVETLWQSLSDEGAAVFNFWSPVCNQNVGDQVRSILEKFGEAAVLACIDDENLIVFAKKGKSNWPPRLRIGKWEYPLKVVELTKPTAWTYYMKECKPIFDGAYSERVDGIGFDI